MREVTQHSHYQWARPTDTERAGQRLAACLTAGDLIGLVGDLGAGKTLFVQGIARGLEVPPEQRITSPTFTLINEYHGGRLPLYHADLYRIAREHELDEIGLDDLCRRADGVVCVEWSDRFAVLGRDHLEVTIAVPNREVGDEVRQVAVTATGARSQALADAWLSAAQ